jgi:dTDP-4-dehydrorhamnose reductase
MNTVLLGPNGQLGTDIQTANMRAGEPLSLIPVGRSALDLSDIENSSRFLLDLDFQCLINCASYHKTDEVERNAQTAFTINTHLVREIAEICRKKNARLIHISTDYVYGGEPRSEPIVEVDCKAPINVYGASKSMGEDLARLTGADGAILRVASLFGIAGASGKGGNFVETMLRVARERGILRVVSDQTMSPTATKDVAEAIIKLIRADITKGIWHTVNSGAATWYEFAKQIIDRSGIKASVMPIASTEFPTIARRPAYSVLSNSKIGKAIGPMRTWQEALDQYLIAKGHREK